MNDRKRGEHEKHRNLILLGIFSDYGDGSCLFLFQIQIQVRYFADTAVIIQRNITQGV